MNCNLSALISTPLLLLALIFCGCTERYQYSEGMVWNTSYHITYQGEPALADSVMTVMDSVGKSLSVFDAQSLVSRVNKEQRTQVDHNFITVYNASRTINSESRGAFDPTLSPLITAWGFGKGHKCTSDTARIDSLLNIVGIEKTSLDGSILTKQNIATQFNFSAIAKGYGCDAVAAMLRRNGVKNYLVEIGGEISLGGESPNGGKWRVSIDRPIVSPDKEVHDSQAILELSSGGVATSGNYRNFHIENGQRLGHTISRVTGRPMRTNIASATVVAATCMEADGYATACMAMQGEQAQEMAERLHLAVMLVMENNSVWMSSEFKKYVAQ